MEEDQFSISQWADETFGKAPDILRVAIRANEEMAELLHALSTKDLKKAIEELADVHIVLARVGSNLGVDIQAEIEAKMSINRRREWKSDGTGHGYHVKEQG